VHDLGQLSRTLSRRSELALQELNRGEPVIEAISEVTRALIIADLEEDMDFPKRIPSHMRPTGRKS
jgi:hypothetical protein